MPGEQKEIWRKPAIVQIGAYCPRCRSPQFELVPPEGEYSPDWVEKGIIGLGACGKCGETNLVRLHESLRPGIEGLLSSADILRPEEVQKVMEILFPATR